MKAVKCEVWEIWDEAYFFNLKPDLMSLRNLLAIPVLSLILTLPVQAQWTPLGGGLEAPNQFILGISAVDADVVWAISSALPELNDHLVRTTDGGQNWTIIPFDVDSNLYAISLHAMDSVNAWLATADEQNPISGKVYKTADGGLTWEEQPDAFTEFNETPAGIYFWNENEGVAFGATCNSDYDDQIAIYYTEDGGNNWTKVSGEAMPEQLPGESMCLPGGNGFYEVVGDTIWFVTFQSRLFRSVDRGKTWEAYTVPPPVGNGGLVSVAFEDAMNGVAGIFPNSVAYTSDGGVSWSEPTVLPFGYRLAQIEYVPETEGTYIIGNGFIGTDPELGISYDNGLNWELMEADVNLECHQFISPSVGFAGGAVAGPGSGGIYKWEGGALTNTRTLQSIAALEIFPNPAHSTVQIRLPEWPADGLFVQLYNAQGQLVRQLRVGQQQAINVNGLPPGIYSITVETGEKLYTGRVVKQ